MTIDEWIAAHEHKLEPSEIDDLHRALDNLAEERTCYLEDRDRCSVCGVRIHEDCYSMVVSLEEDLDDWVDLNAKYCPHCGAKINDKDDMYDKAC